MPVPNFRPGFNSKSEAWNFFLALPLFVFHGGANNHNHTLALDYFTFFATWLY